MYMLIWVVIAALTIIPMFKLLSHFGINALSVRATLLRPQHEDVKARLGTIPQRWHDNLAQSMVTS